ncbi:MAG: TerB family tellurite resistance protein [Nannocystaceae bacterium]|nr:TerB family tellurite resistance protein [bacterium]
MLDEDRLATLLRRAMVLMTRVDGHVDDDEVIRIQWIMRKRFERALGPDDIRALVNEQVAAGVRLHDLLSEAAPQLDHDQKRLVLGAAFAIASADGAIVDEEDKLMARIAQALRIEPAEYRTLLRHAMVAREFL